MKSRKTILTAIIFAVAAGVASYAAIGANFELQEEAHTAKHLNPGALCLMENPAQSESCEASRHCYEVAYEGYHYQLSTTVHKGN